MEQILFGETAPAPQPAHVAQTTYVDGPALPNDESVYADVVFVPLLDVVASAGPGRQNPFPDTIAHLAFPRRWLEDLGVPEQAAYFLDLNGDSMEPTIRDGSTCLLDTRAQTPRVEGVYAMIDGNDVRIKRIGRGWEGKIVLISDNERYASETLAAPDAEALRIAGKIVWAGGKI